MTDEWEDRLHDEYVAILWACYDLAQERLERWSGELRELRKVQDRFKDSPGEIPDSHWEAFEEAAPRATGAIKARAVISDLLEEAGEIDDSEDADETQPEPGRDSPS